jgi:hypothetical protein
VSHTGVSFAPFWLSLLACKLAIQSRTERNFAKFTPPTRFGKLSLLACKLAIQSRTERNFAKFTPPTRFGKLSLLAC